MTAIQATYQVTMTKLSVRALQEKVINNNMTGLLGSINTKAMAIRGWSLEVRKVSSYGRENFWKQGYAPKGAKTDTGQEAEYLYKMYLQVSYSDPTGKKPEKHELGGILRTLSVRAGTPAFGKWTVSEVDGEKYRPSDEDGNPEFSSDLIYYAPVEMPSDWDTNFEHLFGLEHHISQVRMAIEAGISSDWLHRFHCVLAGPPGCGKSDICQSIKRALGEDAVLEFDATATTAAGAIKELSEREILPRILLVEEIEKADEKAMSFLLSVMDLRSQIRKTTARNTIVRDTKLFCIATVNDVELFKKLLAGALASRFSNEVYFDRPGREQLSLILAREISKVGGDPRWIPPALDYCDEHGISDPRRVIAICLCGREKLISGEYQKILEATSRRKDAPV